MCHQMSKLIPFVPGQAKASGDQQEEELVPFLLSSQGETAIWLALAIGMVLCLVNGVQVALNNPGAPAGEVAGLEALYVLALAVIILIRRWLTSRWMVLLGIALVLALSVILGLAFDNVPNANLLGYIIFDLVPLIFIYRFPWRWSLPLLGVTAATYTAVMLLRALILRSPTSHVSDVWGNLAILVVVACIAGTLRARALLILRLRASQARLQAEMERTAELAAARERARIARDIHDVLAHSLTVVSIQAQAARQVIHQQPEQAAKLLDEMTGVLRESMVESRRVVGLLREATQVPGDTGPLGARLLALAERFGERTGMTCALEETGRARELSDEQENTVQFAVQEALTNAYRHGGARHVWIGLVWQESAVSLTIRDDGSGQPALALDGPGGNGLRGMRERAAALGGTLSAGAREEGGFAVSLTLPLTIVDAGAPGRDV
jgi:signal transduction histidine kinase